VTPPQSRKIPASGRLIGYARVSTEDQGTDAQLDELRAAGCTTILEEHASGADRSRPVLGGLLREIRAGETLVVVRLDRLARSVSHLLAVIEQLEDAGAHFRSLRDPIDTTTPQGMFSLQVLGAVAQLERALIAERTKAGLRAARSRPSGRRFVCKHVCKSGAPHSGKRVDMQDGFQVRPRTERGRGGRCGHCCVLFTKGWSHQVFVDKGAGR
jgi:hypothetical protein